MYQMPNVKKAMIFPTNTAAKHTTYVYMYKRLYTRTRTCTCTCAYEQWVSCLTPKHHVYTTTHKQMYSTYHVHCIIVAILNVFDPM